MGSGSFGAHEYPPMLRDGFNCALGSSPWKLSISNRSTVSRMDCSVKNRLDRDRAAEMFPPGSVANAMCTGCGGTYFLAGGEETKPKALYIVYFNAEDTTRASLNENCPSGLILVSSPGPYLDYEHPVNEVGRTTLTRQSFECQAFLTQPLPTPLSLHLCHFKAFVVAEYVRSFCLENI